MRGVTTAIRAHLCVARYGVDQELCVIAAADEDRVLIWQACHTQCAHIVAVWSL